MFTPVPALIQKFCFGLTTNGVVDQGGMSSLAYLGIPLLGHICLEIQ